MYQMLYIAMQLQIVAATIAIVIWLVLLHCMAGFWNSVGSSLQSAGINYKCSIRVRVPRQTNLFFWP